MVYKAKLIKITYPRHYNASIGNYCETDMGHVWITDNTISKYGDIRLAVKSRLDREQKNATRFHLFEKNEWILSDSL